MPRPKGTSSKTELVRLAIAGIDAQIRQLEEKRSELIRMVPGLSISVAASSSSLGGRGRKRAAVTASKPSPAKKKRVVSAATRKKLKDAAKARWARERGES